MKFNDFFIIKGFRTIVFIFIVSSTMFQPICSPAFFRCLSNSGTYTEVRTTSFIESMGVACSDSVSHNRVQVLSIVTVGSRVRQTSEEGRRTYWPKRCGNNNKDEDNSPKTLNDKKNFIILTETSDLQTRWFLKTRWHFKNLYSVVNDVSLLR